MPGGEDGFPAGVGKENRPVFLKFEVRGAKLLAVNERQRQPVGEPWPKLFHHIQSQRGASGAVGVEESHLRIQSNGFAGGSQVVRQERIDKRQQRVDPVQWRAA